MYSYAYGLLMYDGLLKSDDDEEEEIMSYEAYIEHVHE